jgi:hypothetical protein
VERWETDSKYRQFVCEFAHAETSSLGYACSWFVIKDENALGMAYRLVKFRDVMLRSLRNPHKHLA